MIIRAVIRADAKVNSFNCYTWAVEQFGKLSALPGKDSRWANLSSYYYFRDESDAALFLLRWGGAVIR